MRERLMAVYDRDNTYLELLQAYLLKKRPAGFEVLVFSKMKELLDANHTQTFEILMIGEESFDEELVGELKAQKIFVLMENGLSGITGYSFVSKYQSVERLISQVLEEFAEDEDCEVRACCGRNKTTLISFYSPEKHNGQASAALCAAQLLADAGNKVLYISMSAFSGYEQLLGIRYDADITDFMYFALKYPDKLLHKLDSIKYSLNGVDYLPPALDYSDLLHISEGEWLNVMDALLYSSNYTHIIVDLSEVCQGFYSFLEKSNRIYILSHKTLPRGKAVLKQYEELLYAKEYESVLAKSEIFDLNADWESHSHDLASLSASGIGVHMRGIIFNGEKV